MISCGKLGEQEFRKAVTKLLEQLKNGHQKHQYSKANPHGKMTAKQVRKAERPSVLEKLQHFKSLIQAAVVDRTKRKELER